MTSVEPITRASLIKVVLKKYNLEVDKCVEIINSYILEAIDSDPRIEQISIPMEKITNGSLPCELTGQDQMIILRELNYSYAKSGFWLFYTYNRSTNGASHFVINLRLPEQDFNE